MIASLTYKAALLVAYQKQGLPHGVNCKGGAGKCLL